MQVKKKMLFKVTWLAVMVLLIIPEKDMTAAQNTDLTNGESRVSFKIKNLEVGLRVTRIPIKF